MALPQMSAVPPGSTATLRGDVRDSNADLSEPARVAVSVPGGASENDPDPNVTLPRLVESCSVILEEL